MLLRNRIAAAAVGGLVASVSIASAASGAQRYASPTGSGSDCSMQLPCSITTAVDAASGSDEVIVAPGDYPLTTTLATPFAITIHGVAGQPRPRLLFTGLGGGGQPQQGLRVMYGSTLRDVEVDQGAGNDWPALDAQNAQVDQVIVKGSESGAWTAEVQDSTVRDSIVVASGPGGVALETDANGASWSSTYRNVTAIATGAGGDAIRAWALVGSVNVLARNVIAQGGPGGHSLVASAFNAPNTATITIGNSNWQDESTLGPAASIADAGGNQSAAPGFVDAAAGDYHEAAGSPTIDAGLNEFFDGKLDVDGDPRVIGSIDIGADEFVVTPAAITGPATAVTNDAATLGGSTNAHGVPTVYWFEYGPTTAYGSKTPMADAGSGTTDVAATATLSGLNAGTTYHYRLVAANSGVTSDGADQTLTTGSPSTPAPVSGGTPTPSTTTTSASAPSTTPSSTGTVPTPRFAGVRLVSTRLSFGGRFVVLRLSCPTATVGRCTGTTKLTIRRRIRAGRNSTLALGRARFSIAHGMRATIKIRISRAGRRLLSQVRTARGKDANAARDGAGRSKTTVAAVTIRHRHR